EPGKAAPPAQSHQEPALLPGIPAGRRRRRPAQGVARMPGADRRGDGCGRGAALVCPPRGLARAGAVRPPLAHTGPRDARRPGAARPERPGPASPATPAGAALANKKTPALRLERLKMPMASTRPQASFTNQKAQQDVRLTRYAACADVPPFGPSGKNLGFSRSRPRRAGGRVRAFAAGGMRGREARGVLLEQDACDSSSGRITLFELN